MRGLITVLFLCGLSCLPQFSSAWAAAPRELRIGILAFRGAERALNEWDPTIRHLATQLPQFRVKAVPLDITGLSDAVRAETIDFVITNPGHYVELEASAGIIRIASLAVDSSTLPARMVASSVIVRAERADLKTLTDLKGTRLAAVAPEAFGGFRIAWREMAERGLNPFDDTASLSFLGFPIEKVVEAVEHGQADAGIVRACLLEQMAKEGRIKLTDFRVLDGRIPPGEECMISTRLYPDWPFAKLAHTPDLLAKQIAVVLLAMPASDGHAWTVPVDYQPVHDLFRALKIGPYEYLNNRPLTEILHDNWPWLVIALLAALWWLIHVARVEFLVRRRTEELKAAHEEARTRREEMEHGARLALLGEMASSLAHEINQPLAAIANYAGGCERRLAAGNDPEGVAQGVHLILGQAERAAEIVKRIRAFVRKRVPEAQSLDPTAPVREALGLFQAIAARHGVRILAQLPETLPSVRADRIQIEQVVLNLLQNAADAMRDRTQRQIEVTAQQTPNGVTIRVVDSGPGLSPESRAKLFEPFFTTKPEGLGLGLSLSRTIIEAHGGHLWAEDATSPNPHHGACFCFTLPFAPQEIKP